MQSSVCRNRGIKGLLVENLFSLVSVPENYSVRGFRIIAWIIFHLNSFQSFPYLSSPRLIIRVLVDVLTSER